MITIPTLPMLRVRYLCAFQRGLDQLGLSTSRALSMSGISEHELDHPNNCIPVAQLGAFVASVAKQHGCFDLGLTAGLLPRKAHSDFSLNIVSSPTLYETLRFIRDNAHKEDTSAVYRLVPGSGSLYLQCSSVSGSPEAVRQIELFRFAVLLEVIRQTAGQDWLPENVWFQQTHDRSLQDHPILRRINMRFAAVGLFIEVPDRLLVQPPKTPNNHTSPNYSQGHNDRDNDAIPLDYVDAIIALIRNRIGDSSLREAGIARSTGVSSRTLQRYLALHRTSFSDLVKQVKFETACEMLNQSDLSISEISRELGYSHSGHFSRAFSRICGLSPRRYRSMKHA